jgi:hypothetical protein|tara:strand:+ start:3195 stop:3413 length:219 start_codon:yes stop_codon:yes gene_type:complete
MIQPDPDTIKAFAHVAQNVPRVGKFIEDQYRTELERLPQTATDKQGIASGRCQVLGEMCKLLANSTGAQSNG